MDALKNIPLSWIVIGVLVVIVLVLLFRQCRSGFTPTAGECPIGQFSPTGTQPGCMPCPMNTYCPMEGTIAPTLCLVGKTSPIGSVEVSMCQPVTQPNPMLPVPPVVTQPTPVVPVPPVVTQPTPVVPVPPVVTQPTPVVPVPPVVTQPMCPRGQFSPTGKQPGCKSCPINTYCSYTGTITPTNCPSNLRSMMGSFHYSMCRGY